MAEWSEERTKNNVHIDLWSIIQAEIYNFVKREPNQIKDLKFQSPMESSRFSRGANLAAAEVIKYLRENSELIKRVLNG